MSILDRVNKAKGSGDKMFALVMAKSTAGKTTLAGSLPGTTLLVQPRGKEYGYDNAAKMATSLGNTVKHLVVDNAEECLAVAEALLSDTTYDSVYFDGFSALTYLLAEEPETKALIEQRKGGSTFAGYDRINAQAAVIHEAFSKLIYSDVKKPKNVFFTLAFEIIQDGEGNPDITPIMKGKASYQVFTRPSPTIITLAKEKQQDGSFKRIMLTKDVGPYKARINGLLDQDNPGRMEPNLAELFKLIKGEK